MYHCKYFHITDEQFDKYRKAYPGINIIAELINLEDWCKRHPARVKKMKSWPRFLNNCLKRAEPDTPKSAAHPYARDNERFKKQQEELKGQRPPTSEEYRKHNPFKKV